MDESSWPFGVLLRKDIRLEVSEMCIGSNHVNMNGWAVTSDAI